MEMNDTLKSVSVIGAGGKMGRGISLLLLQEMTRLEAELSAKVGTGEYRLTLIDVNDQALHPLKQYLRSQIRRYAERNINAIRNYFADNPTLVSNEEIIDFFVRGALDNIRLETDIDKAKDSQLIFEAAIEDIDAKIQIFSNLSAIGRQDAYYFTNTSSIPIGFLDEKGKLNGRLIGFHFYNPPAVQKLLEIIPSSNGKKELTELAHKLAKRLKKVSVESKDVAGFIGNGHFLREIAFACEKVNELARDRTREEAIYLVNHVTHNFLIRPMGIFQLIDYVGIDVCHKVSEIMSEFLKSPLQNPIIQEMVEQWKFGGQYPDGSQKEGFFKYQDHMPTDIYCLKDQTYMKPTWEFGALPEGHMPWKKLQRVSTREAILENYFNNLFQQNTFEAQLAKEFLLKSHKIAQNLVKDGVAQNFEDVNTVLRSGFYHLYGAEIVYEKTT